MEETGTGIGGKGMGTGRGPVQRAGTGEHDALVLGAEEDFVRIGGIPF